jgi:beta-lactamase regulating signal transducer with metallopeptidase domain
MTEFLEGLLISSVSGTAIAALLFLAKPFVKNKISQKSQYFGWYLVFIRMLLPFSFGGLFIGNLFSTQSLSVQSPANPVLSGNPSAISPATTSSVGTISQQQVSGFVHAAHNSNLLLNDWSILLLMLWLLGLIALFGMNPVGYIGYG